MSGPEMPIFTRTYDLLTWLVPVTNHFPRAHRHTVTRRLLDAAFDLREAAGGGESAPWQGPYGTPGARR
jgi:hypothetical protein